MILLCLPIAGLLQSDYLFLVGLYYIVYWKILISHQLK